MKTTLALLAILLAPAALAGAIFTLTEHDVATGALRTTTTMSVQDEKLLVQNVAAARKQPASAVVFKNEGLLVINHEQRNYMELDRETLLNMAGNVNKAMKQMEQSMAAMSPEQRAMVEKMMGKKTGREPQRPPLEFRNTGRSEKVGDYACTIWEAHSEGQMQWQHCVVPFGKVAGSDQMLKVMQSMSAMMEEVSSSVDTPWLKDAMSNAWEGVRAIDGYPVLTRSFRDGKPDSETVLKSAVQSVIEPQHFEPPADYKKQTMNLPQ